MSTQSSNGKAFEYSFVNAMIKELSITTELDVIESKALMTAREAYVPYGNKDELDLAAKAGLNVIKKLEPNLQNGNSKLEINIQKDSKGQIGDVRDVVASRIEENWEVGISCKHNHAAVKHSRISAKINIGESWFGYSSNEEYFNEIKPIFAKLEMLKLEGTLWKEIDNKEDEYYIPVLNAFVKELNRLNGLYPGEIPSRLISYLLGKNDFYKAIARFKQRNTTIYGYNLYGTLNKKSINGEKPQLKIPLMKLPKKFYDIHFKEKSKTTILIVCDEGWTISCRIHNASSKVENSLKLDVQLVGIPPTLHHHVASWDDVKC